MSDETETPIPLEKQAEQLAVFIRNVLPGDTGFVLMLSSDRKRSYASNLERDSAVATVEEFLLRMRDDTEEPKGDHDNTPFLFRIALAQFEKRKAANAGKVQVDNSTLIAGSPMVYYCRFCGDHTETLAELHSQAPTTICERCEPLRDHGFI